MKLRYLLVLLCAGHMGWVQAEIYKNVDAYGHVTYSSSPSKGAKKLNLDRLPGMPSSRSSNNATPPDFPKVDNSTQRSRDNVRRTILESELAAEERLLAEARQNLKTGVEKLEADMIKSGTATAGDTAKHDESLNSLRAQVTLHENNIKALKTEMRKSK